jgi:tetratricopeptide (TPR) repeat protein
VRWLVFSLLCLTIVGAMITSHSVLADSTATPGEPSTGSSLCLAAIAAHDDDRIVDACGTLLDNEKAARNDRIQALIARAGVFRSRAEINRSIVDYNAVLQLDPALADIFTARGELWWKKGQRPNALADFKAAIKLKPDDPTARANYKRLALEMKGLGVQMPVAGKPSFNCATARRPVEKAICASPELADLDREIGGANTLVIGEAQSPREARAMQREQDEFIARRNAEFGRPGYDLKKAMRERLQNLVGVDGY